MTNRKAYRREAFSLFAIASPIIIAQLAQIGTGVVDTIMAGHYSAMDLAAIAIGYNIWLPLFLFAVGVLLAVAVIVAQDFGAKQQQKVRDALPQSLWLALLLGALIAPACYYTEPLLHLLDLDPLTEQKSLDYLQAVAWGIPGAVIFQALRCFTQGIGIMRPFAIASVLGFLVNIPLNYALIYGQWGAPELGAAGCGIATAISMWLSPLLIAAYMFAAKEIRPYLPTKKFIPPDLNKLLEIFRLGLPIGLTLFIEIGIFTVISLLVATLGNHAMAAHQIAYNVWDVVYMPLVSIGSAMATRVGHAIGRGNREQIMLSIKVGTAITLLVGLVSTLLLLAAPGMIVSAYSSDQGIHSLAVNLIRLAALFIAVDSIQVATSYALRAFKDTHFPFAVMCIAYWLLALPLAYFLGMVLAQSPAEGTMGVWQGLIAGIFIATVLVCVRLYFILQRPLLTEATDYPDKSPQSGQSDLADTAKR